MKKNIREWESLLPHAEFAYNSSTRQTTSCSPFEAVYGMNSIGPFDLAPIHPTDHFSGEADERAKFIKKIHEQVRDKILKQIEKYKKQADKHRKKVVFKEGDLVWIHLKKERFPNRRFVKLQPRVDGSFKIQKINDNAYKVELLGDHGVSATFNVSKLSPYEDDETIDSRTSPFQPGENDVLEQPKPNVSLAKKSPMEFNFGLMVHEVLKAQNIVFYQPTIYFNVLSNHVVN